MFPHKTHASHAYETRRNPLKSRFFAYMLAIASLFGVLIFTEAKAIDVTDNNYFSDNTYDCDAIEFSLKVSLLKIADLEDSVARAKQMNDTIKKKAAQIPAFLTIASNWATIYNAVCK